MPRTRQEEPAADKFNLIELIPNYEGTEEYFLSDPANSQLTNFDDIAQVLISRFERTVPLSTRLQLFFSCQQGVSESVQEFAARIKKFGTQIFQSGNSVKTTAARNANDQLLQSRFVSGLRNDIPRFVLTRDPNTLDESINAALIEEQNFKLNEIATNERSVFSNQTRKSAVISALTEKLQDLNLRVEILQEVNTISARGSSDTDRLNVERDPRFRRTIRGRSQISRPHIQRRGNFCESATEIYDPISRSSEGHNASVLHGNGSANAFNYQGSRNADVIQETRSADVLNFLGERQF
ncbi:hypothetical protein TNIN_375301 [Trichonephila inaurata madagascariensis]|uniref:Retrotransposon gag domain-containing protein n=1 Tax=Trichonephila inaurata madagascariensis TaxID=2747483 RepID=A0A8X7BQG9_9ARAC|nr:hypothetical protein TNIN_375301 [Trichonephila inaurata madagascariensis]